MAVAAGSTSEPLTFKQHSNSPLVSLFLSAPCSVDVGLTLNFTRKRTDTHFIWASEQCIAAGRKLGCAAVRRVERSVRPHQRAFYCCALCSFSTAN